MKDAYLEEISDKIRRGEPVNYPDAVAAIVYQQTMRAAKKVERSKTLWGRFLNWVLP